MSDAPLQPVGVDELVDRPTVDQLLQIADAAAVTLGKARETARSAEEAERLADKSFEKALHELATNWSVGDDSAVAFVADLFMTKLVGYEYKEILRNTNPRFFASVAAQLVSTPDYVRGEFVGGPIAALAVDVVRDGDHLGAHAC